MWHRFKHCFALSRDFSLLFREWLLRQASLVIDELPILQRIDWFDESMNQLYMATVDHLFRLKDQNKHKNSQVRHDEKNPASWNAVNGMKIFAFLKKVISMIHKVYEVVGSSNHPHIPQLEQFPYFDSTRKET